jgi:hypothetical protein
MIHNILSLEQCKDCKGCCYFDNEDKWEIPSKVTATLKDDLFICDELTENGCRLGENKPAECAMYPFRVMQLGDYKVIAVCKYCKPVMDLSMARLVEFVENNYEDFLNTGIVKDYDNEYVIIKLIDRRNT